MLELLVNSTFFGVFLSLGVYLLGAWIQKKLKWPIFNPLLICMAVIIPLLMALDIPYEVYNSGAKTDCTASGLTRSTSMPKLMKQRNRLPL